MPKRLLLADDSITIQKVVELILSEEDFQIISVNDGQEAMEKVSKFNPSIVLADIEMPKINGYNLCKQIKSDEKTKHIPVILLVGAFEPLNERNFKDCGAADYLIKPFESQEFLNKIHAVLGESASDGEVTMLDAAPDEPVDLGDALMGDDDTGEMRTSIDDTGVFEEGQSASDDTSEFQNISDSDLTTRELKDVLESLSGGTPEAEEEKPKEAALMDDDDIEALLAGTMSEESSDVDNSDAQKTVVIAEELPLETNAASAQALPDSAWNEQTQDVATSFASEDVILGISQSHETHETMNDVDRPKTAIQESGVLEPQPALPPQHEEPAGAQAVSTPSQISQPQMEQPMLTSNTGNVLLTTSDVTLILQRSLEQKITEVIDAGAIRSTFKESVNDYINACFKDVSTGLDDMVSESINKKISDVVGTINLEVIVNQVISSTIKGILATLPAEILKMTREITERVVTGVLQDNIPAIKRDVEKVIWEAVPGVAERMINHEIEQIKSEFM